MADLSKWHTFGPGDPLHEHVGADAILVVNGAESMTPGERSGVVQWLVTCATELADGKDLSNGAMIQSCRVERKKQ